MLVSHHLQIWLMPQIPLSEMNVLDTIAMSLIKLMLLTKSNHGIIRSRNYSIDLSILHRKAENPWLCFIEELTSRRPSVDHPLVSIANEWSTVRLWSLIRANLLFCECFVLQGIARGGSPIDPACPICMICEHCEENFRHVTIYDGRTIVSDNYAHHGEVEAD
jgi:hypothetical protein